MKKGKRLSWFMLAVFMLTIFFSAPVAPTSAATIGDIQGHWAAPTIQKMVDQGVVTGMPDGSFKPDNSISRAEFATLVVKAFKLDNKSGKVFNDTSKHWAKDYITTANAYGIVNGYSNTKFGPDDPITREQMAVMIVKAANLQSGGTASSFSDSAKVSNWAKDAVAIASNQKVITGFPDGSFQPQAKATRAQAVVVLSKALESTTIVNSKVYDTAGTYGPADGIATVAGNVTIKIGGVTLQNTVINGDLTIDKAVGEGTVILKGVTVKGNTYINGGGTNSVYFIDSHTGKTYVLKDSGPVRIVVSGTTEIAQLIGQSSANIQETNLTGKGIDGIIADRQVDGTITINIAGVNVESLTVNSTNTNIVTDANTNIGSFVANAAVTVTGTGTISNATINASGVSFAKAPTAQTVATGVTAPTIITTGTSGGGGGRSTVPVSAITAISGTPQVGVELTAGSLTPVGVTASYQWLIADTANGTYANITGATTNKYKPVAGDAGKFIKVSATGTGSYSGTATSNATGAVAAATKEITGFTPLTVVNLALDEHIADLEALKASGKLPTTVTVTDGTTPADTAITDWTGAFDGTATGMKTLTAVWTIPAGYADVTSPIIVSLTVNVNTAQTALPAQSGSPAFTAGTPPFTLMQMSVGAGTLGKTTNLTYTWYRSDNAAYEAGTDTQVATGTTTYTPAAADVGKYLIVVATTPDATGIGMVATTTVVVKIVGPAAPPLITGTFPAAATSINLAGLSTGLEAAVAIGGITYGTYAPLTVDANWKATISGLSGITTSTKVKIRVAETTVTAAGPPTEIPVTAAPTPITAIAAISGTAQVGVQLTAGALIPADATVTYQWRISTDGTTYADITGATTNKYTPVAGDVGKYIEVVATGTGSYSGSVTSAATAAVAPNQGQAAPTETLTGVAPTTFGGNDGQITGTTAAMEYKLASADDNTYAPCSDQATVVAAGTYNVRYAAKSGFNAGTPVDVVVADGNSSAATFAISGATNFNAGLFCDTLWIAITNVNDNTGAAVNATTTVLTNNVVVKIDGATVDAANYTVDDPADTITLSQAYLNTLTAGTYQFTVEYTDATNNVSKQTSGNLTVVAIFTSRTDNSTANDGSFYSFVGTSVSSSAPTVATADLTTNNGYVTITSVGAGSATIYVTDNTNTEAIPVTVALGGSITIGDIVPYAAVDQYEPDNSYLTAKSITTDGMHQTHTISPANDVDWLKFDATQGQTYNIQTSNLAIMTDTDMYLYDTNGSTLLASNDDISGTNRASTIDFLAPATGTYYVAVNDINIHNVGQYDIAVTPVGFTVTTDSTTANNVATLGFVATSVSSSAPAVATADLTTKDGYITITSASTGTATIYVTDNTNTAAIPVTVAVNRITIGNITPYAVVDQYESDNSYLTAKSIATDGTHQTHTISPATDVDWIKFNATQGQTYNIQTSNLSKITDTVMYLYNTNGTTQLDFNDDIIDNNWASRIDFLAPATGTYYVAVEDNDYYFNPDSCSNVGQYDIAVTVATADVALALTTPAADANNTIAVGGAIKTGKVNVVNGTASVVITGTLASGQTVAIGGTDSVSVTADNTSAIAPIYTVDTSIIAAAGGSKTFSLTVSEAGKADIVYTVTLAVTAPSSVTDIAVKAGWEAVVTAVDNINGQVTVADATDVAGLIGAIESTDSSTQVYEVQAYVVTDNSYVAKTSGTLVSGDLLVITAADGITMAGYPITVAAPVATATPVISGTPKVGDTTITGTCVDGATVMVFINNGTAAAATVTGTDWTITVAALAENDTISVVATRAPDTASAAATATLGVAATVISAATSDANHIVLTMSSALTGIAGDPQAFTVAGAASNPTLNYVAVSGKSVTLLLSAAIVNGEIITVSYAKTGSNDLTNGTLVANFTSQPVTNTVGPPTATPTITGIPKAGDTNVSGKAVPGAAVQVILSRYIPGTIGGNFSANADPTTGDWTVDFKAWGVPALVENDVLYVTATLLPNAISDTLTVVVAPAPAPAPAVTSVTVAPATATVVQGGTLQLTATVAVVSGADQTVNWTSSDTGGRVTVDASGLVMVAADAAATDYTITATSTVDGTKTGISTITVDNTAPTASITTANYLSNDSSQFVLQFTEDAVGNAYIPVTYTYSSTAQVWQ